MFFCDGIWVIIGFDFDSQKVKIVESTHSATTFWGLGDFADGRKEGV